MRSRHDTRHVQPNLRACVCHLFQDSSIQLNLCACVFEVKKMNSDLVLLVDVIERADDSDDVRHHHRPDQPSEEHAQVRDDIPAETPD